MYYLEVIKQNYLRLKINSLAKLDKLTKLLKLLDSIEVVEVNNTIMINVDKNIIVNHNGTMLIHSNDGYLITRHKTTHINPAIRISILDVDKIKDEADSKARLLRKQSLFSKLLKRNKIKIL